MNGRGNAFLDLAAIPVVGATLLDQRPAYVFPADGSRIIFCNPAGAAFLGERDVAAVIGRRLAGNTTLVRQLARLAKSLPPEQFRLEMLRLRVGAAEFGIPAQCRRLDQEGGSAAVLALLAAGFRPEDRARLATRLTEAIAPAGRFAAIYDRSGRAVAASRSGDDGRVDGSDLAAMIEAAASSGAPAAQPITLAGEPQPACLVEFDGAGETLYLLLAGIEEGATQATPVPAPVIETPADAKKAEVNARPTPLIEEDVDSAARKSIEEGRAVAPVVKAPQVEIPAPKIAASAAAVRSTNVVRLPGAPVRALPPERLTGTEQDAFRRIAEALGIRMAEVRKESAENGREPAAAVSIDTRLLDRLPIGIIVYNDRETLFANRSALDLLAYDDQAAFAAAGGAEAVFPEGAAAKPARGVKGQVNARRRDGSGVPVEARLHGVAWAGQSAVMLSLLKRDAIRDPLPDRGFMTDLAAAGDRVEELEAILDTATDGVVVIDRSGVVDSVNRSAQALFGIDAREALGKPFTDLFADESRKAVLDYLDGVARNGVASVLNDGREVIGKVPKGGLIPLFLNVGRISGEKFCAVLRDITHWKNVEEELVAARRTAEAANAQKSEFLAKVSHEIRTPLNAIIGFSEVMMEERFGPIGSDRYRSYLRDIHVSGEHLLSLINDLLDLSKIESGKVELAFQAVALNDLIQETVAMMQPQANRQRIIIRSSLATDLPNIVADTRSIRQILLNLLSNAIKFTPAGGQVIVATALEDSGEIELRVRDTGVGMSANDLEAAMTPFRQAGAGLTSGEGTGLGLPLTKALVEANRAAFAIDSAPNQGTLIKITFPTTRVLAG